MDLRKKSQSKDQDRTNPDSETTSRVELRGFVYVGTLCREDVDFSFHVKLQVKCSRQLSDKHESAYDSLYSPCACGTDLTTFMREQKTSLNVFFLFL